MIPTITGNPSAYLPSVAVENKLSAVQGSPNREGKGGIERFLQAEVQFAKAKTNHSPLWGAFFNTLPDTLLAYIYVEKNRLAMIEESRFVIENNQKVAGFHHAYTASDDQYHPGNFEPFMVKGYWIPISEGKQFQLRQGHCPITRTVEGQDQILYLIHPKSEVLFAPIIEKYEHTQVNVPAIALSSFRTLLIALPVDNRTEFTMVKVSLNETIGNVHRLLDLKECAASVANSAMLKNKQMEHFTCLEESYSFVPDARLLYTEDEAAIPGGAGMIHRPVPQLLTDQNHYIIPLYALFGVKNWPLLNTLIEQSQKTPTQFITDALLKPLAMEMVDHIYRQRFYLEVHGQNVLLKLIVNENDELEIEFIYRDMGGVNCRLSDAELEQLPEHLRDHAQYWEHNFVNDAAVVMEGIAKKVLFNLTKVFFKMEPDDRDSEFCQWRTKMIRYGYQDNWTLPVNGGETDEHRISHTRETFYRYGYFEKIFAYQVLEAMSRNGIFLNINNVCPENNYAFFSSEIGDNNSCDKTCVNVEWFFGLVTMTLPYFIRYQDAYSRRKKISIIKP